MIKSFLRDERGATAIEYGLIAALISVSLIACMTLLGGELGGLYESFATDVSGAIH
jgi:pilus assembly protein Flp/PilA